jgi:lipoyl(octanoyl) transferase
LGLRSQPRSDLSLGPEEFHSLGVELFEVDRGGQATLHSPGQVVIFPMLDLKAHRLGVKKFVEMLFTTATRVLSSYDIESSVNWECPGLYTRRGKIGSCGIRVDRGVVRHGLSVNVTNDLSLFDGLNPCGASNAKLDRVANYSCPSSMEYFSPRSFFEDWCREWRTIMKA